MIRLCCIDNGLMDERLVGHDVAVVSVSFRAGLPVDAISVRVQDFIVVRLALAAPQ